MERGDWQIVWFSVTLAAVATLAITPCAIAMAWLLARRGWRGKSLVETMVSLPLVMPPVATGLILLRLFGRRGPLGHALQSWGGMEIVFTWKAVLLALAVMSFPLMVRTVRVALEQVNPRLEQVARTLGASRSRVLFTITLPLALRGIIGGMVLGFARALGEFGATIMVAGAIPGKTQTMSVAIFNFIQLGHDEDAFRLLGISIVFSFAALLASEVLFRRPRA